jgi:Tfp pilus assembly protein PilO
MTLRPRDRIALAAVLIVGVVAAYYLLALRPEQRKSTALDAAIAVQQQTLTQEQQAYAAGRAAEASLKADTAQWAALSLAVPSQSDIPALLRTLERNANAVHVKMQAIVLTGSSASAPTSSAPASSAATGSASTGATASSAATSVPVQLTFGGGYTALNSLVRRLEGLVVVSGGKVHATGPLLSIGDVSLSGSPKLTVQLTATIYQLATASTAATTTGG